MSEQNAQHDKQDQRAEARRVAGNVAKVSAGILGIMVGSVALAGLALKNKIKIPKSFSLITTIVGTLGGLFIYRRMQSKKEEPNQTTQASSNPMDQYHQDNEYALPGDLYDRWQQKIDAEPSGIEARVR